MTSDCFRCEPAIYIPAMMIWLATTYRLVALMSREALGASRFGGGGGVGVGADGSDVVKSP